VFFHRYPKNGFADLANLDEMTEYCSVVFAKQQREALKLFLERDNRSLSKRISVLALPLEIYHR
jgi:dsDNA-binding SOS-regulon protein